MYQGVSVDHTLIGKVLGLIRQGFCLLICFFHRRLVLNTWQEINKYLLNGIDFIFCPNWLMLFFHNVDRRGEHKGLREGCDPFLLHFPVIICFCFIFNGRLVSLLWFWVLGDVHFILQWPWDWLSSAPTASTHYQGLQAPIIWVMQLPFFFRMQNYHRCVWTHYTMKSTTWCFKSLTCAWALPCSVCPWQYSSSSLQDLSGMDT